MTVHFVEPRGTAVCGRKWALCRTAAQKYITNSHDLRKIAQVVLVSVVVQTEVDLRRLIVHVESEKRRYK
jgi:hypothetical protein